MKNRIKNILIILIIFPIIFVSCEKFEEVDIYNLYSFSSNKNSLTANSLDTAIIIFQISDSTQVDLFKDATIKVTSNIGKFENGETNLSEAINYNKRSFKLTSSDTGTATIDITIKDKFKKSVVVYFKKPVNTLQRITADTILLDFPGFIENKKTTTVNFAGTVISYKGKVTESRLITMHANAIISNNPSVGSFYTSMTDGEGGFTGKFYLQDSIAADSIKISAIYADSTNHTVTTTRTVRLH